MMILLMIFQLAWSADTLSLGRCDQGTFRTRTSGFCPRLEGAYPKDCCPMIVKSPALQCYYYTHSSRQDYQPGQRTVCVTDSNGIKHNETNPCCDSYNRSCKQDMRVVEFKQRLIRGKTGSCCFENCPPADYWREQPLFGPSPLTSAHKLLGSSTPSLDCDAPVENTCGGLPMCEGGNDPCPIVYPPSPPNPPGPGPGNGGGGPNPPNPSPTPEPPTPTPPQPLPIPDPPPQ